MVATPVEVRRAGLQSMRRLLPRMQLAGRASAVLHPLIRILSGPADDLRREVTIGAPYPLLPFTPQSDHRTRGSSQLASGRWRFDGRPGPGCFVSDEITASARTSEPMLAGPVPPIPSCRTRDLDCRLHLPMSTRWQAIAQRSAALHMPGHVGMSSWSTAGRAAVPGCDATDALSDASVRCAGAGHHLQPGPGSGAGLRGVLPHHPEGAPAAVDSPSLTAYSPVSDRPHGCVLTPVPPAQH